MILLTRPGGPAGRIAVALFGHGLIGRSVTESLMQDFGFVANYLPYPWQTAADGVAARAALEAIRASIQSFLGSGHGAGRDFHGREESRPRLVFAWFAGRAGPMASEVETRRELSHFNAVLDSFGDRSWGEGTRLEAQVVSSAGGLFEGASLVQGAAPRVSPIRPYGRAKARIEARLADAGSWSRRCIYRPSSVFGPPRRGCRRGLITTLLVDALKRRESVIFASPDALRDYIWSGDIGDYVARRMVEAGAEGGEGTEVEHLVSGEPQSILSVKRRIERFIGRPILARFVPPRYERNSADIVFSGALRPPRWRTRGLDECIATLARSYLSGSPGGGARAA